MANWSILKAAIANIIKTNGNQEITGQLLQNVLNNIVSSVGENSTFAGIATPATNPGVPDGPVFYFANKPGVYSNFSSIIISYYGICILYNDMDNSWKSIKLYECLQGLGTSVQFPISQRAITNRLNNLQIEFIKRLQGTSEDSDALHDPHKWLGSMTSEEEMNTLLDGLHTSGAEGIAKAGYFRGDITGTPFTVENIPVGYNTDTWLQSVRGYFKPADSGKRLTRSGEEYAVLWRKCAKGAWGVWERLGGGVGRPAEGVTGGEIFNDYENNTVSGDYAHAEGQGCSANGDASHAEGKGTDVEGHYGHAEGLRTIVENDCEHAEGCYNVSNTGTRHSIGIGTSESDRRNALEVMDDGRVYVKGVGGYDGVLDEEADRPLQDVLEEALSASEYTAFDFGVLQEKIGSGRTQGDLDAFGLTEEVWAKIRGAEIMVVRDDAHERTYVVTGSSDDYISFAYGMSETYEGWEIKQSGNNYIIFRHQTQGGGGGESIIIE
jgi:hypothetical protein